MRTGILVQARLGSVRLPQKALLTLPQDSCINVLERLFHRLKQVKDTEVIVVTPDDEIADVAEKNGILYSIFKCGDRNVLAEFYHAAIHYNIDPIVRITADCPCVSPKLIEQMLKCYNLEDTHIVCNHADSLSNSPGIDGLDVEVFSGYALETAYEETTEPYDKEHVTPWMYRNLKHSAVMCDIDIPRDTKLSIDTQENYEFVCDIFRKLGGDFEICDLIRYFKEKK